ncbi:hypothetical protein OG535_18680 [Kitasatospora sp. NBC_00085]|uniref:hypothetical protein n=1 Tax=unclassified Kitasatospora TaxID=2633591 RepID=UPI0032499873
MTNLIIERNFPPCLCANCNDAIPEARLNSDSLTPVAPAPVPTAVPPVLPYRPVRRGEAVFDVRSGRWGAFMAFHHGVVFLRPFGGGVEWDTDPRWLSQHKPPTAPAAF